MPATMLRANISAFASGASECGKSRLLWDLFVKPHPRRVSYDPVGDTFDRNPRAIAVRTSDELARHVRRATASGCDSWHFVIYGEADEAARALDLLAPTNAAPNEITLARALGGVLFECGEIDTLAPNAATELGVRVRAKWQRGRHSMLSFAVATQAPALVSRIVTGNSKHIFAFAHTEHTSVRYFASKMGEPAADAISRLPRYSYVYFNELAMSCAEYRTELRRGGEIQRIKVRDIRVIASGASAFTD